MADGKYVVFKADDWGILCKMMKEHFPEEDFDNASTYIGTVHDAVVIRRQDMFAPAALHVYASSISMAAQLLISSDADKAQSLQRIADYFHEQATEAEAEAWKLPD